MHQGRGGSEARKGSEDADMPNLPNEPRGKPAGAEKAQLVGGSHQTDFDG